MAMMIHIFGLMHQVQKRGRKITEFIIFNADIIITIALIMCII